MQVSLIYIYICVHMCVYTCVCAHVSRARGARTRGVTGGGGLMTLNNQGIYMRSALEKKEK